MADDDKTDSSSMDTPVIIDLGKQKKKKVRKLREGGGSLLEEVRGAISELQRAGRVAADTQTVVVVVTEQPKSKMFRFPMMMR